MSTLAVHPYDNSFSSTIHLTTKTNSYCFYQQLNTTTKTKLQTTKQIIPSIPRARTQLPKNSSLSPIRNQKIIPRHQVEPEPVLKRPYPLITTFSSPASTKRHRKVSFNEQVVVVCTLFDHNSIQKHRRHSTGQTLPKSILIHPPLTKKFSLKQFTNKLF